MESELKIRYEIYDVFGDITETAFYTVAEDAYAAGESVCEVHETTWKTQWISGKNIVHYEWH